MALKCVPWPKCRPYQSREYSQYVGYLGGKSGKEHLLTWSYCPRRSQACSRREWGRVRVCHIFGSLKRPPFWQRVEQFDKELVPPPQAGLKFHHMGQRPGPTSCLQGALGAPVHPRASRPHWPIPALPLPGGLAARLGHCVLKRSRALVTVAKQRNACWLCPRAPVWAQVCSPGSGLGWKCRILEKLAASWEDAFLGCRLSLSLLLPGEGEAEAFKFPAD